jgi:hypothetical protein
MMLAVKLTLVSTPQVAARLYGDSFSYFPERISCTFSTNSLEHTENRPATSVAAGPADRSQPRGHLIATMSAERPQAL